MSLPPELAAAAFDPDAVYSSPEQRAFAESAYLFGDPNSTTERKPPAPPKLNIVGALIGLAFLGGAVWVLRNAT